MVPTLQASIRLVRFAQAHRVAVIDPDCAAIGLIP